LLIGKKKKQKKKFSCMTNKMKRVRRGMKKGKGVKDGPYVAGRANFGGSKKLLGQIGNILKKTKALSTIGKAVVPLIKNKQASNIASQVVGHIERAGMGKRKRRGAGMMSSMKKMNAVVKSRVRKAFGMGMMSALKKLHNVVKTNKLISKAGAAVIPMIKNKQIQSIASKAVDQASAQGYGKRRPRGGSKAGKFFKQVGRVLKKTKLVSTLGKALAPMAASVLGPESAPAVNAALGMASKAGYGKMKRRGFRNTYGAGIYDYSSRPPQLPYNSGNPYNNVASVLGRPIF
jgi:hypothetical protein